MQCRKQLCTEDTCTCIPVHINTDSSRIRWDILVVLFSLLIAATVFVCEAWGEEYMPDAMFAGIVLEYEYGVDQTDAVILANVISDASRELRIPVEVILAVMAAESNFDPDAVSVCNAIGLMQVRPAVWQSEVPYNIHNKYGNVYAGVWVLRQYKDDLGTLSGAIQAYNVGISAYKKGVANSAADRYLAKVHRHYDAIRKYPRVIDTK